MKALRTTIGFALLAVAFAIGCLLLLQRESATPGEHGETSAGDPGDRTSPPSARVGVSRGALEPATRGGPRASKDAARSAREAASSPETRLLEGVVGGASGEPVAAATVARFKRPGPVASVRATWVGLAPRSHERRVVFEAEKLVGHRFTAVAAVESGRDGRFVFDVCPEEGPFYCDASHADHGRGSTGPTTPDDDLLVVPLRALATVNGRVVLEDTGDGSEPPPLSKTVVDLVAPPGDGEHFGAILRVEVEGGGFWSASGNRPRHGQIEIVPRVDSADDTLRCGPDQAVVQDERPRLDAPREEAADSPFRGAGDRARSAGAGMHGVREATEGSIPGSSTRECSADQAAIPGRMRCPTSRQLPGNWPSRIERPIGIRGP